MYLSYFVSKRIYMESFNQNVIKHKTGFLNLAVEPGNIT